MSVYAQQRLHEAQEREARVSTILKEADADTFWDEYHRDEAHASDEDIERLNESLLARYERECSRTNPFIR